MFDARSTPALQRFIPAAARDTLAMATIQTPSKYATLVSGDGFEFVVLREAALVSPIIKGMLDVRSA